MLTLPAFPRRAHFRAFGLVVPGLGSLALAALAVWARLSIVPSLLLGLAVVSVVVSFWRPQWFQAPYAVWNRIVDFYLRALRLLVKGICFYIIVAAVGRTGGSLQIAAPAAGASQWVPREPEARQTDAVQVPPPDWFRLNARWAARSGNLWTLALLPFFRLLAQIEPDEPRRVPTSIYTLY